ncbi:MAG: methionine gamma-lyase [Sphingomonadales bacterium]|nr:methionine gamma-lyase [Sphingomonadales bacterium]
MKPSTELIDGHYLPSNSRNAVKMPLYLSSNYVFNSAQEAKELFQQKGVQSEENDNDHEKPAGMIYSRLEHPNLILAESRLAAYEGADAALFFESGMAAISTLFMGMLAPGDTVLHTSPLYGGTDQLLRGLLQRWGVHLMEYAPHESMEEIIARIEGMKNTPSIRMIYVETPANPTLQTVDFGQVMELKARIGRLTSRLPVTSCDNTLLGPVFQKPLQHGIDIGIYSATKFLGGHSDLIAGALVCSRDTANLLRGVRSQMGGTASPHTSWLITRSMETLELRMEASQRNAVQIVEFLKGQPQVQQLFYPGLLPADHPHHGQASGNGSLLSFELRGGQTAAFRFLDSLGLIRHAVSLGGTESMACHSATTTHSNVPAEIRQIYGVSDGLIRLSVGIEHVEDLIADLRQALKAANTGAH